MNLYPEPNSKSWQPWSQSEDDYLIKFYGKIPIAEMAKTTGRTYDAVRKRLSKISEPQKPKVQRKRGRTFPEHLKEPLKHFICDVVEDNPGVQVAMRERLSGRL